MTQSGAALPRVRSFGPVLAPCAGLCFASHAQVVHVPQTVRFAPGASSAELHGAVVRGAVVRGERALYSIRARRARAGRRTSLRISAVEDNAVFQVYPPGAWPKTGGPGPGVDGDALPGAGEGDDAVHWTGVLPRSGAYLVVVGPTRGNATYRLSVEVR